MDDGDSHETTQPPMEPAPRRDPEVGRRLGDEIAEAASLLAAGEHWLLTKLRQFDEEGWWNDQNAKSASHWLRWRLGMGKNTANEKLRVAHALARLPRTNDLFRRGVLSYSQVRAITRVATLENEATLISYARHATGSQLEKICSEVKRQLRLQEQPDLEDVLRVAFRTRDDGSEEMIVRARPEQAAVFQKAIELMLRCEREVPVDAESAPPPAGAGQPADVALPVASPPDEAFPLPSLDRGSASEEEERALEALLRGESEDPLEVAPVRPTNYGRRNRADEVYALASICDQFIESQRPDKVIPGAYEVLVLVDLGTLSNTDGKVVDRCELMDGTKITPETARRLTCDCPVVPVLLKPDGAPIDVGRRTRAINAGLERALLVRDRTCTFPGCDNRLALDAHHIQHWAQGGETNLDNLTLLCRRCHTRVHEGGYTILVAKDGTRVFLDPDGRVVARSGLREVPGDVLELLRARSRAAGLAIDASTNLSKYDGTHRPDLGGCVGSVLDRTVGSRFYFEPKFGRVEPEVA